MEGAGRVGVVHQGAAGGGVTAAGRSSTATTEVVMRIMVIILSSFAALVMVEHISLPLRLALLAGSGGRSLEALGCLGLFGAWALATALVFHWPGLASGSFALAGGIGLAIGERLNLPVLTAWGGVALGLALLTLLARREQQVAKHQAQRREHHEEAVYLALRRLQETVPELLTRVPECNLDEAPFIGVSGPTSVPNGLAPGVRR